MTRTVNATYPMKINALVAIAAAAGQPFLCGICGKPILPGQRLAFDHTHAVGRGGKNRVEDLKPVHDEKARDSEWNCHTRKTAHPRGPHTAIGGDTFEAAKTPRIALAAVINKPPTGQRPPRAAAQRIPARKQAWPAKGSRPMRSKSGWR